MSIQKQGMERPGGSASANRMMGDGPMNQPASVRKTAPHLWWALAVLVTGTFIAYSGERDHAFRRIVITDSE